MPLYEYRKNATNRVVVPPSVRQEIVCGTKPVLDQIFALIREKRTQGKPACISIDGWYGVDWAELETGLRDTAQALGITLEIVSIAGLFLSTAEIEAYRRPHTTDDPSFGYVNSKGVLEDILDPAKVAALKARLSDRNKLPLDLVAVVGPGAAVSALEGLYDLRFYADFTMQPLLWQMWDGKLVTFGCDTPAADY